MTYGLNEPSHEQTCLGFLTRSDTNQAEQLLKMARGSKLRTLEVEGLFSPCRENKGANQLFGNRAADLGLCFRICIAGFLYDVA